MADFFKVANADAAAKGLRAIYKTELVKAWDQFAQNPCYDTATHFIESDTDYGQVFFTHCFTECCPGGSRTLMDSLTKTPTRFPFRYAFGSETQEFEGLVELSAEEYAFFPREFKREVVYNAPELRILGREWKVMIGAVEEKIYKVAACIEIKEEKEAIGTLNEVSQFCTDEMGDPKELKPGVFVWKTNDGTIILHFARVADSFMINFGWKFQRNSEFSKTLVGRSEHYASTLGYSLMLSFSCNPPAEFLSIVSQRRGRSKFCACHRRGGAGA